MPDDNNRVKYLSRIQIISNQKPSCEMKIKMESFNKVITTTNNISLIRNYSILSLLAIVTLMQI